jgi:hypothetical protein
MKRLSKTKLILMLSLAALAVSASIYAYLYISFIHLKRGAEELKVMTAESKGTYDELAKIKENLKDTLGTEDRLRSLFVASDAIVDFIQVLEEVMKTAGVQGGVEDVTEVTTPELDAAGKKELHLSLVVTGPWNSILKLESLVENIPYRSTINSASMQYKEGDKGASWQETVMLTVIVDKSPEELNKAAPKPATDTQDETL